MLTATTGGARCEPDGHLGYRSDIRRRFDGRRTAEQWSREPFGQRGLIRGTTFRGLLPNTPSCPGGTILIARPSWPPTRGRVQVHPARPPMHAGRDTT